MDVDESEMDIETRHRQERKQLQAQIQQLKKSATKGEKKKRKEVNEQVAEMERALDERHQRELAERAASGGSKKVSDGMDDSVKDNSSVEAAVSAMESKLTLESGAANETDGGGDYDDKALMSKKPNKQQARKLRKQQEQEALRREAEERFRNRPDPKAMEQEGIRQVLQQHHLQIHEIIPDGHCLYNAIAHQISEMSAWNGPRYDYKQLRRLAADYMIRHEEDFMPFLLADEILGQQDYEKYCDKVANSAEWGGQLEIQAIAEALQRPIFIYQSGQPVFKVGEQYGGEHIIRLSYHRYAYGLGEHYNSLVHQAATIAGNTPS